MFGIEGATAMFAYLIALLSFLRNDTTAFVASADEGNGIDPHG